MLYSFICPNCKNKITKDLSVNDINSYEIKCDKCNSKMRRDWKASIQIGAGDRAEDIQSMSFTKERMKNRPSGKTQVYY